MTGSDDEPFRDEVQRIVSCAMEVSQVLGRGLQDRVYENALVVELRLQKIPLQQQPKFEVIYKDVAVGKYIPDLICFDQIIVNTRTVEVVTDDEREQVRNYLMLSGRSLGLLLNFRHPQLQWERIAPVRR